jgi:hypothetical protein
MTPNSEKIAELTKAVRKSFEQQPHLAEGLLADLGMDSRARKILHHVARNPGQTVLTVSDAFTIPAVDTQRSADELKKLGMINYVWTPEDGQTPSLALEEKGLASLQEIQRRERKLVVEIAKDLHLVPISVLKVSVILGNIARELSSEQT